jgi:hypothetical protein
MSFRLVSTRTRASISTIIHSIGATAVAAVFLASYAGAQATQTSDTHRDTTPTASQTTAVNQPARAAAHKQWYERLSLRGYTQLRYNGLFNTNSNLTCAQCDRSIGKNGGFFLRRARVVLSGDVSDRLYIYIQPDFASDAGGNLNYAQLRDAYFDLALDHDKEFRLRFGQSKIPFGWQNLQSSGNRLALDRDDAMNSAVPNERDMGVFAYWAPARIRKRFKMLVDSGLKGTGDYGVIGAGAYNGQGLNRSEANQNLYTVLRVTYPFQMPNGQFVEVGAQGYTGRYILPSNTRTTGLIAPSEFKDERLAASFILYPQPIGLQAEWNFGKGPEFDPATSSTSDKSLNGGYVQTMYRVRTHGQVITPFVRAQRYDGGKKSELDARLYRVRELEIGTEWLPLAAFEFTAMYTISDRRYEDLATPNNRQKGQLLRLQAQFNY